VIGSEFSIREKKFGLNIVFSLQGSAGSPRAGATGRSANRKWRTSNCSPSRITPMPCSCKPRYVSFRFRVRRRVKRCQQTDVIREARQMLLRPRRKTQVPSDGTSCHEPQGLGKFRWSIAMQPPTPCDCELSAAPMIAAKRLKSIPMIITFPGKAAAMPANSSAL